MWGDAVAAGTARPAAATRLAAVAQTLLDTDGLASVGREHATEPFLEVDLGLPPEHLTGSRDVGLTDLRIVDRQRLEDNLARRPGHLDDVLREVEDRELPRVAEVDREMLAALGEQHEPADQIVDVAEAPRLRAVSVDRDGLVREGLPDEVRDRAAVVRAHARAVGVEDP